MRETEGRKVLLLDGHSLAYRAFFALPESMTTASGQPTNAVYGFTSMLFKVMEDEQPDAVLVAFDGPRDELKRMEQFPEYKAHRPTMPDNLRSQMGMIEGLLEAMRIPVLRSTGHEADDVIGTLARRLAERGDKAVIVTGDKDTLQLVDDRVRVVMTGRGITETVPYDRAAVEQRYGVPPEKMADITGLKGDTSDNIPGVPGIGEKGASALIQQYGTLENLYEHLDEISGAKRKQSLAENKDLAFLSRALATIHTDVPVEVELGEVKLGQWDRRDVLDHLGALEFKTLARRFLDLFGGLGAETEGAAEAEAPEQLCYSMVDGTDAEALVAFINELRGQGAVALAARLSGTGYCDVAVDALALAGPDRVAVLRPGFEAEVVEAALRDLLQSGVAVWAHDGKGLLGALHKQGIALDALSFDTAVAAYLENPSLGTYHLWDVFEKNVGESVCVEGVVETLYEQASLLPGEASDEDPRLAADAARVYQLKAVLEGKLDGLGMRQLFETVEMPLVAVLGRLEETGVALDTPVILELSAEAGAELARLEREICEHAGREFNIGSTRQLGDVLFNELKLPAIKKTKTGFSTDASVLEALREEHPIIGKIVEYREYAKLKSTYFDVLPALVCPATCRVHGTFNQLATSTGRISSSSPNLQNIPIRTEVGRRIRAGFVPGQAGWKLLVADYSQIELRVLAHMSRDPLLLQAFAEGADVHRETAAEIFGVPYDEVSGEMRRMAKVVNFGVVYGMGYYGLSSRLGISIEDATRFIDTYFEKYAGVREYRDRCIAEATERGHSDTMLGRRRYIPQLRSENRQTRELGERLAINTPLQGTAADIIKKAMVDVDDALLRSKARSTMILQIHDELMFEVPPDETEVIVEAVTRLMSGVVELAVPLEVDVSVCDNWGEAKQ